MAKASHTFTAALTLSFSVALTGALMAPSAAAAGVPQAKDTTAEVAKKAEIRPDDYVFSGDWDRDGRDSLGVLRDGKVLLADDDSAELGDYADYSIDGEGRPVVGHWGTTTDTVALDSDGIAVKLRRWFTDGDPDRTFAYGNPGDVVFSGSWNGSSYDGPGVRRGSTFYIKTDATTGVADQTFDFGKPGGEVLVGDWDGDGVDGVAVRHGDTIELRNDLSSGDADKTIKLPSDEAAVVAGDFDGDGTDAVEVLSEKSLGKPVPAAPASEEESLIPLEERLESPSGADSKDSDDASDAADTADTDDAATDKEATDAKENDDTEGSNDPSGNDDADANSDEPADSDTSQDAADKDEAEDSAADDVVSDEASSPEGFDVTIGDNAEEGLYRIKPQNNRCDLSVLYSDGSNESGRVEKGENSQVYITLEKGDALSAPKCDIELIDLADINPTTDVPTDGEWLVGADVPAGDYHVKGDENCFASVLSDTSRHANITVSVEGTSADVTVEDGQMVSTDGCEWSTR